MLKILGLAIPKHTSTFQQDFLQLIFQRRPLPLRPPLKPHMEGVGAIGELKKTFKCKWQDCAISRWHNSQGRQGLLLELV